jgi:hypothetical protein
LTQSPPDVPPSSLVLLCGSVFNLPEGGGRQYFGSQPNFLSSENLMSKRRSIGPFHRLSSIFDAKDGDNRNGRLGRALCKQHQ